MEHAWGNKDGAASEKKLQSLHEQFKTVVAVTGQHRQMSEAVNPYVEGLACGRIAEFLEKTENVNNKNPAYVVCGICCNLKE